MSARLSQKYRYSARSGAAVGLQCLYFIISSGASGCKRTFGFRVNFCAFIPPPKRRGYSAVLWINERIRACTSRCGQKRLRAEMRSRVNRRAPSTLKLSASAVSSTPPEKAPRKEYEPSPCMFLPLPVCGSPVFPGTAMAGNCPGAVSETSASGRAVSPGADRSGRIALFTADSCDSFSALPGERNVHAFSGSSAAARFFLQCSAKRSMAAARWAVLRTAIWIA